MSYDNSIINTAQWVSVNLLQLEKCHRWFGAAENKTGAWVKAEIKMGFGYGIIHIHIPYPNLEKHAGLKKVESSTFGSGPPPLPLLRS